jgi:UDP-N-acetylglucosamine 2-epimerase
MNIIRPFKCVIGYDITPEGRISVEICHNLNIESVCIQHGSIAGEPLDGEHIVDSYILYGFKAKKYLEGIGNKSESLKVFGAPYLDKELFDFRKDSSLFKILELNQNRKTLLVALSGPGHCTTMEHFNEIVRSLVLFAKNNPSNNLIFKLHRKDSIHNYNRIFKGLGFSCPLIDSKDHRFPMDIFYWLNNTDLLITGSSTVALEAMLRNKPVVTIDYKNQYRNVDFIETNCTYHITKEIELRDIIYEALNSNETDKINANARAYINEYFYTEEKSASARIAEWLLKREL